MGLIVAKCAIYSNGFSLSPEFKVVVHSGGGRRGKLTGKTSSACFRRLREWCITHDCNGDCWGITLTVPGLDLLSVEEFKKMHHLLCVWCNDNRVPIIWRVELQKRKMPHLHIVCYGRVEYPVRLMCHWYKLLSVKYVFNDELIGKGFKDVVSVSRAFCRGSVHAVQLERLSGDFRSYRYLVAHMSKGKQDQMGWAGRSWGVCCRALFDEVQPIVKHLPMCKYYRVARWVRRWTRRKYFSRNGCAFWVSDPAVLKRMLDYVQCFNDEVPF